LNQETLDATQTPHRPGRAGPARLRHGSLGQAYPSKPVRLIVPFAPGGTTDIVARVVAEKIQPSLGQLMIVENKGGGGGIVGASEISKAAPDGYTLGMATVSTTASNPAINPKTPYNPLTDFTSDHQHRGHAQRDRGASVLPGQGLQGLPGRAEEEPRQVQLRELRHRRHRPPADGAVQVALGTFVTHIPYRGAGPRSTTPVGPGADDLRQPASALPFIKDGRLVPIVVAAPERLAVLPNVPTFKEVGLEPVNRMAYYGIHGPRACRRTWWTRCMPR
jgi:tripartite-type tricarboxylate transporter receptor subunit TctC